MNKISYRDIDNQLTEIIWYSESTVADPLYEFCADGTPLRLKWAGDRYDTIRGSSIAFNVLIQSPADRAQIYKLLDEPYYVRVQKNVTQRLWIGRVFPQLFTEVLEPYPYTIQIKATDQLGRLDSYRPLMTDFPEPFNAGTPNVTVLDMINKLLSDESFMPIMSEPTAPTRLNISMSIYFNSIKLKAFETTYLDPLSFMDDNDRYQSKYKILDAILKPFQLKLYQWQGEWWLMSWDAEWNSGDFEYVEYDLDFANGWTFIGQNGTSYGIFDLFADCRQLKGSASLEFLPAWQGIQYSAEFIKNNNIIPAFSNRSGSFYGGTDQQRLEVDKVPAANLLRHWQSGAPDMAVVTEYLDNAGWLNLQTVNAETDEHKLIRYTIPALDYNELSFSVRTMETAYYWVHGSGSGNRVYVKFLIRFTPNGGTDHYLKKQPTDTDIEWSGTPETFNLKITEDTNFTVPLPANVIGKEVDLEVRMYKPHHLNLVYQDYGLNIRDLRIGLVSSFWEGLEYKDENLLSFFEVNINGSQAPVDVNYKWGMTHQAALTNSQHGLIINVPFDRTGNAITAGWMKEPITDMLGITQPLKEWALTDLYADNSTVTRKIKGSFVVNSFTSDILPFRIVKDSDDRYYQFLKGEYDDKNKTWKGVEFIEFKAYKT